ncbi:MAG: hypothetical protein D6731_25965 [Planctomycetota bacterium]|nr:MAG: hypothetical protein D6731_25965 [Planctomycetota bacterium]
MSALSASNRLPAGSASPLRGLGQRASSSPRRRTCTVFLLPWLLLAASSLGEAQESDNSINLHHLTLAADGRTAGYTVDAARTLRAGEVHLGASFSHAQRPLELGRPGDRRRHALVHQLTVLDLYGAVGILDGLSFGASLPVVLDNDGHELLDPTSDTRSGGVGALRVQLKWAFFDTRRGGQPPEGSQAKAALAEAEGANDAPQDAVERGGTAKAPLWESALALQAFATFHTGRPRDYLSDNESPTVGITLLATFRLWRFRVGTEFGYEQFTGGSIDIGDLEIENRLRFGASLLFEVLRPDRPGAAAGQGGEGGTGRHDLAMGGEVFGWADASRPFHNERERPIEALGVVAYRHRGLGFAVRIAAGGALNNGIGAPDVRYLASLGWTF